MNQYNRLSKIVSHISSNDTSIKFCHIFKDTKEKDKISYTYDKCLWHPYHTNSNEYMNRNNYDPIEFNIMIGILNRLKLELTTYSSEYKSSDKNKNQIYEIKLYNIFHPNNKIEKWWWVDTSIIDKWTNTDDIILLTKYGWDILIYKNEM